MPAFLQRVCDSVSVMSSAPSSTQDPHLIILGRVVVVVYVWRGGSTVCNPPPIKKIDNYFKRNGSRGEPQHPGDTYTVLQHGWLLSSKINHRQIKRKHGIAD